MGKPILTLDFDGVIHLYQSGWLGAIEIPDPPVEGVFDFIKAASEYFEINVFSSRSGHEGGIAAMQAWMREWFGREDGFDEIFNAIGWPTSKPPSMISIDDRALTFWGDWTDPMFTPKALFDFQTWTQGGSDKKELRVRALEEQIRFLMRDDSSELLRRAMLSTDQGSEIERLTRRCQDMEREIEVLKLSVERGKRDRELQAAGSREYVRRWNDLIGACLFLGDATLPDFAMAKRIQILAAMPPDGQGKAQAVEMIDGNFLRLVQELVKVYLAEQPKF